MKLRLVTIALLLLALETPALECGANLSLRPSYPSLAPAGGATLRRLWGGRIPYAAAAPRAFGRPLREGGGVPLTREIASITLPFREVFGMLDMLQRLTDGRSFSRAARHPSGLAQAARVVPPPRLGDGYEDAYLASPEFVITAKHITARRTFSDDEPGLGRLVFIFHLRGRRVIELAGDRHELNEPAFAVCYQAEGVPKRSTWVEGDQETAVVVGFWPEDPPLVLRGPEGVSPPWRSVFAIGGQRAGWLEQPLSLEMEQASRLILAPKVHPTVVSHFLTTKANELLCLGLDAVLGARVDERDPQAVIRTKLKQVRGIIESRLQGVPPLGALAEAVGLSPAVLSAEFHAACGCSVAQYVLERRMTTAAHLLASTDLPLKRIAYEVGYRHTSNFCLAFKRHFGRTAHRLRLAAKAG
jgi:AraC-like DNA-binding protein